MDRDDKELCDIIFANGKLDSRSTYEDSDGLLMHFYKIRYHGMVFSMTRCNDEWTRITRIA